MDIGGQVVGRQVGSRQVVSDIGGQVGSRQVCGWQIERARKKGRR